MREISFEQDGYTLYCEEYEPGMYRVRDYRGGGNRLELPRMVTIYDETFTICQIGKKAFLGCTGLRQISIPGEITLIDDWAFAQCEHLKTVVIRMPEKEATEPAVVMQNIDFGRGVFDDCRHIEDICVCNPEKDDLSALLSAVIYRMQAEYLLKDIAVGHAEWYLKWDHKLLSFLEERDDEGYTNEVLCGEEDLSGNIVDFMKERRRRKSALCLLRLMHPAKLEAAMRDAFENYLLAHTKGCTEEDAWEVLLSEFSENADYYKLFASIGGIHADNIDLMLDDMGEKYAEAKAFLIGYKREQFGSHDVFDEFCL